MRKTELTVQQREDNLNQSSAYINSSSSFCLHLEFHKIMLFYSHAIKFQQKFSQNTNIFLIYNDWVNANATLGNLAFVVYF